MTAADRKDAAQERYDEAYRIAYDAADSLMRLRYHWEFGPEYRAKHPYQHDHAALHAEALRMLGE